MNQTKIYLGLFIALISNAAFPQQVDLLSDVFRAHRSSIPNSAFELPSDSTKKELSILETMINSQTAISGSNLANSPGVAAAITAEKLNIPAVLIPDQLIVKVDPSIGEDIHELIKEFRLNLVHVYPEIGAFNIVVPMQESTKYLQEGSTLDDLIYENPLLLELRNDPRVLEVIPNFAISPQNRKPRSNSTKTVMTPIPLPKEQTTLADSKTELIDWGVNDIEADKLWNKPGSADGQIVGVIDVGFARHKDISYHNGLSDRTPYHDHGTHVAGIICAKHNNSFGIKGVVPSCFVRAQSGEFLPIISEGDSVDSFLLTFSQIISTFNDFIRNTEDIRVFNASLGYNWMPNFGINVDDPAYDALRSSIQNQAVFLLPVLKVAQDRNALIFSAAGNDSATLAAPMSAVWASPFNYAAKFACEMENICSGVVVEAHDQNGSRADFSNKDGDVSCPGVDVFSSIAYDKNGQRSDNSFGKMSGTSMASPYCAGGFALLSSISPKIPMSELLDCVKKNGEIANEGLPPRMKLNNAFNSC